jgi:hypothetical protein
LVSKDRRYFFAVGQRGFEVGPNFFSTVVPIAEFGGSIVDEPQVEFPSRGRAWWMVKGEARVAHAPPGCLIISGIEDAMDLSSSPDKDLYQLLQPTLPGVKDLLEILTPDTTVTDPNELLDDFRMRCNHEPTRHVLMQLGEYLYGPLKVELDRPENDRLIEPEIRFTKPIAPHTVYRFEAKEVIGRPGYIQHETIVQRDSSKPNNQIGHAVKYKALTGERYQDLRETAEEVELVSLQDAVRQVSRNFLSRRELREFLGQMASFVEEAQSSPATIMRTKQFLLKETKRLESLDQIFDALLGDEKFQPRIDLALATEVERRVNALAAQIDARAKEKVAELSTRLAALKVQFEEEKTAFERERARRLKKLSDELEVNRQEFEESLDRKRDELSRQEEIVSKSLETVAARLSTERTGVLNDYLSLEPLLQRLGLVTPAAAANERENGSIQSAMPAPVLQFPDLPDVEVDRAPIPEEDFFERFVGHVNECGFVFDQMDLLAFHLAAKERSPVILGGASGSGKSSLPVLYAEALAGEAIEKRFLAIDVNPSWTSPADLLGYMDAFEHRFIPSASGMLSQMIGAHCAHNELGSSAPVFPVCLEELNLAQPEHYLSDIMQAISRARGNQFISVFDPNSARADDPFRPFARLEIPPNLMIVGTVNFDETTRPLSMRLLDRCNIIEFEVDDRLPLLGVGAQTGTHQVKGKLVLQGDRHRWLQNANVPVRVVEILGDIQPELNALGCGLTHRRQTLICGFIANAPESLCTLDQALDMQLRQRILPQVGKLYRSGAMDALRRLSEKLGKICDVPRTLQALNRLEANERAFDENFLGEE